MDFRKELRDIIWKDNISEPTEILIKFYQNKEIQFTEKQLRIIRHYKPETILRQSRDISKPEHQESFL